MHVLIPLPAASWEAFRSLDVVNGEPRIVKLFLVRQGWLIARKVEELKDVFEGSLEFDKHIANKREQNGVTTCLLQHEVTAVMRCHLRCKKQVEIRRSQKQFGGKSLCASCDHLHVERVLNTLSCIVMYWSQYNAMNLWP